MGPLFALLMAAAPGLGDFRHSPDPQLRALAGLPQDVRVHVDRAAQCAHWAGEEAYDKARGLEIERAVDRLHCERLDAEDAVLRRRHAHEPAVLKALDRFKDGPD